MPVDDTQLNALVADVEAKQQALADSTATNDTAQAAAQAADAQAAQTLAAQNAAHQALDQSIDALVAYVTTLK